MAFGYSSLYCQSNQLFSDILKARKESVYKNNDNSDVASILTGKRYSLKYPNVSYNAQFFEESPPASGTLTFDGVDFENIKIQYDLYGQKVIVLLKAKNNLHYVSVDDNKVSSFSINKHKFTYVRKDSVMKEGIYQLAYSVGQSSLFVKRKKTKKEVFSTSELRVAFIIENEYYIKNPYGTFHIKNKKNLLEAYQGYKKIKSTIQQSKIKLSKKNIEPDLISAISLLESKSREI